jgi:hypothetical protein
MPRRVREGPIRARKNMDMDPAKLAEAQRVLGASSETETVDMALDYVLFQSEVFGALDRLAALGGLEYVYPTSSGSKRRRLAER